MKCPICRVESSIDTGKLCDCDTYYRLNESELAEADRVSRSLVPSAKRAITVSCLIGFAMCSGGIVTLVITFMSLPANSATMFNLPNQLASWIQVIGFFIVGSVLLVTGVWLPRGVYKEKVLKPRGYRDFLRRSLDRSRS